MRNPATAFSHAVCLFPCVHIVSQLVFLFALTGLLYQFLTLCKCIQRLQETVRGGDECNSSGVLEGFEHVFKRSAVYGNRPSAIAGQAVISLLELVPDIAQGLEAIKKHNKTGMVRSLLVNYLRPCLPVAVATDTQVRTCSLQHRQLLKGGTYLRSYG